MRLQLTWRKYKSCKHNSTSQECDCAISNREAEAIFKLPSLSKARTQTLWNVPQRAALASSRRTAKTVDPTEGDTS